MSTMPEHTRRVVLALFLFLLSLYLLNFSGWPHSSDGIAMLATAESVVRRADLDMNAYLWMGLQQGSLGPDGELYSRKAMGQVLASLPLAWLGLHSNALGLVQAAMILSPLIAALTACCLYVASLHLGCRPATALVVALLYGLATPALPYSKYFFSDPLAGLSLSGALVALLLYRHRRTGGYAAACGACLGLACLARTTSLAVVPIFAVALYWPRQAVHPRALWAILGRAREMLSRRSSVVAFATPVALSLALVALFNYLRFGDPLTTGYLPQESFSGNWPAGIAALLVSPGRGLFLYAPLFLVAVAAWPTMWRGQRVPACVILGVLLMHVLIYGKWFMWHGGYCWGPRFLMPAVPLLTLPIGFAWERAGRWRRVTVGLAALSFLPQLLGSLVHFALFQDSLLSTGLPLYAPETFWQPRFSPLLGQWHYVRPENLDFFWVQASGQTVSYDWLAVAALAIVAVVAATALCRAAMNRRHSMVPLAAVLLALVGPLSLVRAHSRGQHEVDALLGALVTQERPGDAIILTQPQHSLMLSDRYRGRLPAYGLPPDSASWLERLSQQHPRLWLLQSDDGGTQSREEQWLAEWGYQMHHQGCAGWRLSLYARPTASLTPAVCGQSFAGGITLAEAAILVREDMLFARLRWQATVTPERDYKVFVHAFDDQGQLIGQHDGMPALWTRPTSTWHPGETIEDKHGLLLPPETHIAYMLVGLYDPQTGARLPTMTGHDAVRLSVHY